MKCTQFSPLAEEEAADTAEWYDARRAGLGDEFLNSVRLGADRLDQLPDLGTPFTVTRSGKTIRRLLVAGFPYAICYPDLGTHRQVIAHEDRQAELLQGVQRLTHPGRSALHDS